MKLLSCADFRQQAETVAARVMATPEIAKFCSSPLWQLAAHDQLHGLNDDSRHFIVEQDGNYLVFAQHDEQPIFFPFELGWMFGSPLIGDPEAVVKLLFEASERCLSGPAGFVIGGVPAGGRLHQALGDSQHRCRHFREFPGVDCMSIDLSSGVDAWLARRSKKFRRSLRQGDGLKGLKLDQSEQDSPAELFSRIVAVEQRTIRWREEDTVFQVENYARFYREVIDQLQESGGLRVSFAIDESGSDLAYLLGGVQGQGFRGLQMSYVEAARPRGLGNALQLEMLRRCADEGILHYDLGMRSPYKERWADKVECYVVVFVGFD